MNATKIPGYSLRDTLGEGGMGIVYRAVDDRTGREVALKLLTSSSDLDLASRRFRREFRAAAKLKHAHAARVFDFHSEAPLFYTMELVEGRPLNLALEAISQDWNDPGRLALLRRLTGQLLVALTAVHDADLIHRDLKPANVLVGSLAAGAEIPFEVTRSARPYYEPLDDGSRPFVKLVDFGLAWLGDQSGDLTKTGAIVGTIDYISPEQVLGGEIDSRADLYALGVVLFEQLTGRPPFEARDTVSLLLKHAYEAPPSPSLLNPAVDSELEAFVLRLLQKEPADRFPTARDALQALSETSLGDPRRTSTVSLEVSQPKGLLTPRLVGREEELRAIRHAVAVARDRRLVPFILTGEAGIGKSRLLEELAKTARMRGFATLSGTAHDEQGFAFAPFLPVLDALARDWRGGVDSSLADAADILSRFVPRWGELLAPDRVRLPRPSADQERYQVYLAISEVIRQATREHGLVIIIEDVHLADSATLDLLGYLARSGETAAGDAPSLLLAVSLREDEIETGSATWRWLDAFKRCDLAVQIRPDRLDEDSLQAMASSMLAVESIPSAVIAWLLRESQGVPFVAGELLAAFAADGFRGLSRSGSELRRGVSGELSFPRELPSSITELVRRRLVKLGDVERKVAAAAALVGHEVPFDLLQAATALEEDDLLDRLQVLLSQRIMIESREDPDLFLFPSKVVRDVLTSEMFERRRRKVHERVAETIESRESRRPEDVVALAHHWQRAGKTARAVPHLILAVDFHRRRLDNEAARDAARAALEYLDEMHEESLPEVTRLGLLLAYGEVEAELCNYERSTDLFVSLRDLASDAGEHVHRASALLGLADLDLRRGDYSEATDRATVGLELATTENNHELIGRAHTALGRIAWHRGSPAEALEEFQKALAVERGRGETSKEATALNNIGYAFFARGEFAEAEGFFDHGLALARGRKDLLGVAKSLEAKASMAQRRGRYRQSAEALDEASVVMRRLGDRRGEAYCIVSQGNLEVFRGAWLDANALYDDAEAIFVELGEMRGLAFCASNRGRVLTAIGDYGGALQAIGRGRKLARKISEHSEIASCQYALAELSRELRDWDEAARHDALALVLLTEQEDRYGLGLALAGAARTSHERGEPGLARRRAEQSLELVAAAGGMPEVEAKARTVLAMVLGDPEEASKAASIASDVGLVEQVAVSRAVEAELALDTDPVRAELVSAEAVHRFEELAATLEGRRASFLRRDAVRCALRVNAESKRPAAC